MVDFEKVRSTTEIVLKKLEENNQKLDIIL